jgi:hypothetical protein
MGGVSMVIGVCFKILPDFEDMDPVEWENPGQLDFGYVKKSYGCFDEAALERMMNQNQDMQRMMNDPRFQALAKKNKMKF